MGTDFTLYNILWYIVLYAFIGWVIEVIFCSIKTMHFVNRGFLSGPVCPIYGFGATAVILLLGRPVQNNVLLLFVGSVVVTSALELATGWALDKLFHTRWWDYSQRPLNVGGYICLEFSLAWGLACILLLRVIHPLVRGLVGMVPGVLGIVLLAIIYAVLLADIVVTLNVILKLNRDLGEIQRIADSLQRGSETMAKGLGTRAVGTAEKLESLDIPEYIAQGLETSIDRVEMELKAGRVRREFKQEARREKMDAGLERLEELLQPGRMRRRLLRAFPTMQNERHAEALKQLRERMDAGSKKSKEKNDGGPDEPAGE